MPDPDDDPISFEFADEELTKYTEAQSMEEKKQIERFNKEN